jgi:hypothetical protein
MHVLLALHVLNRPKQLHNLTLTHNPALNVVCFLLFCFVVLCPFMPGMVKFKMSSDDEDLGDGVLRLGLGTSPIYHFYF